MRKIFILVIFLSLIAITQKCTKASAPPTPQSNCLPSNLQVGIIAFYPFSAGSLNDISGNNYHLTNPTSAKPGTDRSGNSTCAFNFSKGNDDYLIYLNPTFINDFQTKPFSISIWYNPSGIRKPDDYELLIGRDTSSLHCPDTYGQWSLGLYDFRRGVFGINQYSIWDDHDSQTDVWQHMVITCIGTEIRLYRNGKLTTDKSGTGCLKITPTLNSGNLFIGKKYTGSLDDIIIYNRVLSLSEINQLYTLPACCL